jgi:uncharacterized membrane protein
MPGLTVLDAVAMVVFACAWLAYHVFVERSKHGNTSLNSRMNRFRVAWMLEMAARETRIIDTTIMASLQNGSAFFASTSLIAVGGALALLQSTDAVLQIFADLPLGLNTTRAVWEMKVIGLAVIFVYAFFKFAWGYRLFNYAAILMGATPMPGRASDEETRRAAMRAASMTIVAGTHFNRGQRAFFFALAYLVWFLGPWPFMAATLAVLVVMWRRQFASPALSPLLDETPTEHA